MDDKIINLGPANVDDTDMTSVPILDLSDDITARFAAYTAAIETVLRSGQFIGGPNVVAFEAETAAYLGVRYAIGCNSGTDALVLSLRALRIGPGHEVITTPFTFFATAEAISLVGATPVFCDIDPITLNLDVETVAPLINERTRAIIPVHLFGLPADMAAVMSLARHHNLAVLEDVAQAMGASCSPSQPLGCCLQSPTCRGRKVGSIGNVSAFSFFPSKNLGAFGDGGLVATNDDDLADRVKMLRNHGSKVRYQNEMLGYNSRLDELQAAILRVKLPHLDEANAGRHRVAARYNELLDGVAGVSTPLLSFARSDSVFHQYTVRIKGGKRDAVSTALNRAGIATMIYYPIPVHRLPVYNQPTGLCPEAEAAAHEVLSLPIWPTLSAETQQRIATELKRSL
jgi:dTDP-4-amino-4,6-dideoxygalactose transaminase